MNNKSSSSSALNVYSTTGFSDIVASPVFYSVLVLTILLGLASAFGFLQNPLKLKAVVEVISHKVSSEKNRNSRAVVRSEYVVSKGFMKNELEQDTSLNLNGDRYSILVESALNNHHTTSLNLGKVSFDYNITSRQFWRELDSSNIESALEESQRKNIDSLIKGAPVTLY